MMLSHDASHYHVAVRNSDCVHPGHNKCVYVFADKKVKKISIDKTGCLHKKVCYVIPYIQTDKIYRPKCLKPKHRTKPDKNIYCVHSLLHKTLCTLVSTKR